MAAQANHRQQLGAAVMQAIAWAGPVGAAEPDEVPAIVVTASPLPETPGTMSQSRLRLPLAEQAAPAGLADLLRNVATLHVDQTSASGGFSSIYLRGADPSHTVIMIDGVKVGDPTNARGGGIDLSHIDPRTIAHVEVLPGASSALHGPDAMAGVVNIVTRQPDRAGWRAGAGAGGHGYRQGFMNGSARSESVGLQVRAAATRDGRSSDTTFTRSGTGTLRLAAGDPDRRHATAWVRLQHVEQAAFPDDSGGPQHAVHRELEHRESQATVAALTAEERRDRVSLRLYSNVFEQASDLLSPGVAPGLRDRVGLPRAVSSSRYRRWASGAVGRVGDDEEAFALVGLQYEKERGDTTGTLRFDGFSVPSGFSLSRHTRSLFTEGRIRLGDRWTVQGGLRADAISTHDTHRTLQAAARYRFGEAGPNAALSVRTGFKPPSFFALGHPVVGNSDLKPEESRTVELSMASADGTSRQQRFAYRASLFRSWYRHLVDFDPGPPPLLVNRSDVEISGMDVSFAARATSRLNLQGGFARLFFELPPGSPPLRSRPRLRGTAAAGYDFLPGLTGSIAGSWIGRFHDSSIPTGPVQLGSTLLVDASVSYRWHDARITLAVDNLLDRDFQQLVGFAGRGRRLRLELSAAL